MKILYYTNDTVVESEIQDFLSQNNDVTRITERPTTDNLKGLKFDILISDRSRFIIPINVIEMFDGLICNLHPSFLPFNRGDQPLLWSAVEGTPYGVSIHQVSEKFDEGSIISQTRFNLPEELTLHAAYMIVRTHMVDLFKTSWSTGLLIESLRNNKSMIYNNVNNGTTKSRAQGRRAVSMLPNGWDTTIKYLKLNRNDFLNIAGN
jgi:methionyl-tRNA formyltransferase